MHADDDRLEIKKQIQCNHGSRERRLVGANMSHNGSDKVRIILGDSVRCAPKIATGVQKTWIKPVREVPSVI